ncbi:MAG: [Fe-S]-binding protein [Pirellulales bacterium]
MPQSMNTFPRTVRVRQSFDATRIDDVEGEVRKELARLSLRDRVAPGESVAITCGSRGVANIRLVMRAAAGFLRSIGAEPFIVPAMGSHGGGTAEGQRQVLESYGVTEEFCGCPIRSSMETVIVCETAEGFPVHFDRHAYEAQHVLVVNRVKPHTGFVGDIESGLMKMMLIDLGKHAGAKIYHRAIKDYSFDQIVRSVAGVVLTRCHVVGGLALVENGYEQTAKVEAVMPQAIYEREKGLLRLAKRLMPRLPLDDIDVLLIDQIGKNISGTGMDTNIIGRKYNDHVAIGDETPRIKRIIVRGLTHETHGNATGIGLSEFCLSRVVEEMDARITNINCITGGHPTGAMVPIHFPTDRETLEVALSTIGLTPPEEAKLAWIHNTLEVAELELSEACLAEVVERANVEILGEPRPLPLDDAGMLPDLR